MNDTDDTVYDNTVYGMRIDVPKVIKMLKGHQANATPPRNPALYYDLRLAIQLLENCVERGISFYAK